MPHSSTAPVMCCASCMRRLTCDRDNIQCVSAAVRGPYHAFRAKAPPPNRPGTREEAGVPGEDKRVFRRAFTAEETACACASHLPGGGGVRRVWPPPPKASAAKASSAAMYTELGPCPGSRPPLSFTTADGAAAPPPRRSC